MQEGFLVRRRGAGRGRGEQGWGESVSQLVCLHSGHRGCCLGGVEPPQRPLGWAPASPDGFGGMGPFLGLQL